MTPTENKTRNQKVKKILAKEFGTKNVSVRGGKGTSYGWCDITIKVEDPCPHKQHEAPCSDYCKNKICTGNKAPIRGGWGDTVRQLQWVKVTKKARKLLEGVTFTQFCTDMGTKLDRMNIEVNYI